MRRSARAPEASRRLLVITMMRQVFVADSHIPASLYFGTTSGEIWMSPDEGATWQAVAAHLPYVLAATTASPA